jgi:hypothetical protein
MIGPAILFSDLMNFPPKSAAEPSVSSLVDIHDEVVIVVRIQYGGSVKHQCFKRVIVILLQILTNIKVVYGKCLINLETVLAPVMRI